MKLKLLCALLTVGTIFGSVSVLSAQNPVDTTVVTLVADTLAIESDAISVLSAKLDEMTMGNKEMFKNQADRLSNIERSIAYNKGSEFHPSDVIPFVIMIVVTISVLLIIFWVLKFAYQSRVKRYELKKLQIERAEYLPAPMKIENVEMSMTRFIRRLMIVGIVIFFILAWVALVSMSGIGFFETILLMGLLGGVGFAVVHLFKLYVQRRDEDK